MSKRSAKETGIAASMYKATMMAVLGSTVVFCQAYANEKKRLGSPVDVLSAQDIGALPVGRSFSDVLFNTPGVHVDTSSNGQSNVDLRGLTNADTFTQYGGGDITGRMIGQLDPSLVGYDLHTGIITSNIAPIVVTNPLGVGHLVTKTFGTLNVGYTNIDNDNSDDDNNFFGTRGNNLRIGMEGVGLLGNSFSNYYGYKISAEAAFNYATFKSDDTEPGCDIEDEDRKLCWDNAYMWVASAQLGKLEIGIVPTASWGLIDIDLGGLSDIYGRGSRSTFGNHDFTELGRGYYDASLDVAGRETVTGIRYISPTLAGFSLSASVDASGDDHWDVALRYAGEFGAIRVAAGLGYSQGEPEQLDEGPNNDETLSTTTASISIQHTPTGLFLSGGAAYNNLDTEFDPGPDETDDGRYYQVRAGISQRWTDLGKTKLWGTYSFSENSARSAGGYWDDSQMTGWGVGVSQQIDVAAMELYLSYKNAEADINGQDDNKDSVVFGARIKF